MDLQPKFFQCELFHWADVLDMFDDVLETACKKEHDEQWVLPIDLPENEGHKQVLLQVRIVLKVPISVKCTCCNMGSDILLRSFCVVSHCIFLILWLHFTKSTSSEVFSDCQ